jgi:hypothetical protein
LLQQVSSPHPLAPTPKSAQQVRQKPTRAGGPADIAQLKEAICIDTISINHSSKLVVSGITSN